MDKTDASLDSDSQKMLNKKDLMQRVIRWGVKSETQQAQHLNDIAQIGGEPLKNEKKSEVKKAVSEISHLETDAEKKLELGVKALQDLRREASSEGKAGDFYTNILVSMTDQLSKLRRLVERRRNSQLLSPKGPENRE